MQKGDSLYDIAQRNGQSLASLKELNPDISNPDGLRKGMKVRIPTPMKPVRHEKPVKKQENTSINEKQPEKTKKEKGPAIKIPLKKMMSKSMPVSEFLGKKEKKVVEEKKVENTNENEKLANEIPNEPIPNEPNNEPVNEPNNEPMNEPINEAINETNVPANEAVIHSTNEPINEPANEENIPNNEPVNEPDHKMMTSNVVPPMKPNEDNEWGLNIPEENAVNQVNNEPKAKEEPKKKEIPFMEEYPNLMGPAKKKTNTPNLKKPSHFEFDYVPNKSKTIKNNKYEPYKKENFKSETPNYNPEFSTFKSEITNFNPEFSNIKSEMPKNPMKPPVYQPYIPQPPVQPSPCNCGNSYPELPYTTEYAQQQYTQGFTGMAGQFQQQQPQPPIEPYAAYSHPPFPQQPSGGEQFGEMPYPYGGFGAEPEAGHSQPEGMPPLYSAGYIPSMGAVPQGGVTPGSYQPMPQEFYGVPQEPTAYGPGGQQPTGQFPPMGGLGQPGAGPTLYGTTPPEPYTAGPGVYPPPYQPQPGFPGYRPEEGNFIGYQGYPSNDEQNNKG